VKFGVFSLHERRDIRNPSLYFGLGNCPDFIFWLRNERQKSTLVRSIEPHGLHDESYNKLRSKAQCLANLVDLSRQEAFTKKGGGTGRLDSVCNRQNLGYTLGWKTGMAGAKTIVQGDEYDRGLHAGYSFTSG